MDNHSMTDKKLEESIEYYFGGIPRNSRIIYLLFVIIITVSLVSMAIVQVRISVSAYGILRPVTEKSRIYSLVPGKVLHVYAMEGQTIFAGDTLMHLETDQIDANLKKQILRKTELEEKLRDIRHVVSGQTDELETTELVSLWEQFYDRHQEISIKYNKASRERKRQEVLFLSKLISEKEFDDLLYQEELLRNELSVLSSSFRSEMEILLDNLSREHRDTELMIEKHQEDIRNHVFISPVNGFIEEFSGIYEGTNIIGNQLLFAISPDTALTAEIYLPPSKAGMIRPGQEVRLLIDSYNYREWGALTSVVSEISNDVVLINSEALFRVKCNIQESNMTLQNGFTAPLRQGMTLRARLFLNKRTVIQIIFDRVERWMVPE